MESRSPTPTSGFVSLNHRNSPSFSNSRCNSPFNFNTHGRSPTPTYPRTRCSSTIGCLKDSRIRNTNPNLSANERKPRTQTAPRHLKHGNKLLNQLNPSQTKVQPTRKRGDLKQYFNILSPDSESPVFAEPKLTHDQVVLMNGNGEGVTAQKRPNLLRANSREISSPVAVNGGECNETRKPNIFEMRPDICPSFSSSSPPRSPPLLNKPDKPDSPYMREVVTKSGITICYERGSIRGSKCLVCEKHFRNVHALNKLFFRFFSRIVNIHRKKTYYHQLSLYLCSRINFKMI